ncbi:hypothetical protein DYB31_010269 [Aphanomyces astaci]|nr:hypothetical protein DYB31_010269 [Aphanomyces astaci]
MNYYMEARMKKEAEKRDKELQEKLEKSKLQEEFDNEWAALARETQELKKAKKLKKPTKTNTRVTNYGEVERTKREKAEEADVVRRHLHAAVTQWALGKPLLGLLNSLHEIPELQGVIGDHSQVSNDPDSIKKGYRALIRIIHPDKLRNASVQQQLVANEVFTVVNQAFDGFKQAGGLS